MKPIKINETLTAQRLTRGGGWVLNESYTGKDKDGKNKPQIQEYFYGSFDGCLRKACDIQTGHCVDLHEIKELLKTFIELTKK